MIILEPGIEDVTNSIWDTVLGLPVQRVAPVGPLSGATVTCVVQVDGAWEGAVVLTCPQQLATQLAAAMFDSVGEPSASDVQDALGEITNIMAGNIKALLPHPSRITLPVVAFGSDYQLAMLGTHKQAEVAFACQGATFVVSVLQQSKGG